MQVLRWIDNCTAEQHARLYHKFDNSRGIDYARAGYVELDATKTMEECLLVLRGRGRFR